MLSLKMQLDSLNQKVEKDAERAKKTYLSKRNEYFSSQYHTFKALDNDDDYSKLLEGNCQWLLRKKSIESKLKALETFCTSNETDTDVSRNEGKELLLTIEDAEKLYKEAI